MIPVLGPLPLQSLSRSLDSSGMLVVIHWSELVLLELLDRPHLAGIANSDEPRPLPPLESSVPTLSGHL